MSTIHFMFNMQPHYHHVTLDAPYEAITVKTVLDEAYKAHKSAHVFSGEPECPREKFQLRYMTEESDGFSPSPDVDQDDVLEDALTWYENTGYSLGSTCIGPDESSLVKSVVGTPDTGVVRLYVIAAGDITPTLSTSEAPPLLAKRRLYIEELQASPASDDAKSSGPYNPMLSYCHPHPNLGPWTTVHVPVFAYARAALNGMLPVYPDVRPLDENFEVLDGKAFDIRVCAFGLRNALEDVKYEPDDICIEDLSKLLRELFDDPALEVNAKLIEDGGYFSTELVIHGECHTAHGIPAPYIMGKVNLNPWDTCEVPVEGFVTYKHAVVGSKYAAIREMTCCPCLIVAVDFRGLQFYAAYFSDRFYRVLLCEVPVLIYHTLDGPAFDGPAYEYSNPFKLQVIRKTAQELRRTYAAVHTGSAIPNAPHLFPPHAGFAFPELPFPLDLVDRVPVGSHHTMPMPFRPAPPLLFTGFLSGADGLPVPVHVKFVRYQTYGVAAHRLLVRHESEGDPMPLAPAFTHHYMLPDVEMVVMRTLEGDTLEHLLASGATVSEEELQDIHTAVRVLHRHGLVHGNIRPSNVILQRPAANDPDGTTRAYLIDFNLAGEAGKVLYPGTLNRHIRWPRPTWALRGRPITKQHDLFMLKHLLSPPMSDPGKSVSSTSRDLGPVVEDGEEPAEEVEGTLEEKVAALGLDGISKSDLDAMWSARGFLVNGEKAVDFGRQPGAAVYPAGINPYIVWPRPAEELFCQPITKAHDVFMVEQTLRELKEGAGDSGSSGSDASTIKA